MGREKLNIQRLDQKIIGFFSRSYLLVGRLSLFVIFFWFGFIKLLDLSPASPLAMALTDKTVGLQYFHTLFTALALLECLIGILFLFPKAVRVTILLLFFHMAVVSAPLLLVPELTWQSTLVPTLEGQYIIKNLVVIALAFSIVAHTKSLLAGTSRR